MKDAIDNVKDASALFRVLNKGHNSLDVSSLLIHRWPTDDHKEFHMTWALPYVKGEIVHNQVWNDTLYKRRFCEPWHTL